MAKNKYKVFFVRAFLHLLFVLGVLLFFRYNSFLRPAAYGAMYKEYIVAFLLVSVLYANYLFFIPKFYLKRHYLFFIILALFCILFISTAEIFLVSPNIKHCFPTFFNEHQVKLTFLKIFVLIVFRNIAFFLFFFMLGVFENEVQIAHKERIALSKSKGFISVSCDNNNLKIISIFDIFYIQHERNYTYIHTIDGQQYCKYISLSNMEEILPDSLFIRINRYVIIPISRISFYSKKSITISYGDDEHEMIFSLSEKYVSSVKEKLDENVGLNCQNVGLKDTFDGLNVGLNSTDLEEFFNLMSHNDDLKTICIMIANDPSVTIKTLSETLHVSTKTIERKIKILKDKGILQHNGAKKNGEYVFSPIISAADIKWLVIK